MIVHNGIAILENDTHVSKWVIEHGKLDIARTYLDSLRQFIPEGGTVADVGAMIGDHTITYSEFVGPKGTVLAFEPNEIAFDCLEYNTQHLSNVQCWDTPLSDRHERVSLVSSDNVGASFTCSDKEGELYTSKLDDFGLINLDFIKIDVEGFEVKVLNGAKETIQKHKPVILCEVNKGTLIRAGTSVNELVELLESFGYTLSITDPTLSWTHEQFDVLCLPNKKPH